MTYDDYLGLIFSLFDEITHMELFTYMNYIITFGSLLLFVLVGGVLYHHLFPNP